MIIVIIAGGSGTRLWPLSMPGYPKHLLQVNGHNKSLVQNTYDRVKKISNQVYVITEAGHAHIVKEQLGDLPDSNYIIEPARRGTASCIIVGIEKIARSADNTEPIAFVAADHYIRDIAGFRHSFKIAESVSKKEGRIVLVGVEPDHPATGFGYIEKGVLFDEKNYIFNVNAFKEKPDFKTAQQYVKSGNYLWNCGYFVGSVNAFLSSMKKYAPDLKNDFDRLSATRNEKEYQDVYLSFENNAIDYALIERVKNLLVVPASFDWMDLGSFADLHKSAESDELGNHTKGNVELHEVKNTFVQNHEEKPVAIIGLDNVAVINSPNGILVTRKDMSQAVGDISKKIHAKEGK
jgi:mannose-1-phosphate guanylyltransferase/mannose-6-phosphate isomerase